MKRQPDPAARRRNPRPWAPLLLIGLIWSLVLAAAAFRLTPLGRILVASVGLIALAITLLIQRWSVHRRWVAPLRSLAQQLPTLAGNSDQANHLYAEPELVEVIHVVRRLRKTLLDTPKPTEPASPPNPTGRSEIATQRLRASMTRSGLFDSPPSLVDAGLSPGGSDLMSTEMVSRLEPEGLRWIDSSPAEQKFLGWSFPQLRTKSFLEIVHPEDRARAENDLREALTKGEAHGLIFRIYTAQGKLKAVEMNASVRYGTDISVTHLRCHLTDITAKVRAEHDLRQRTQELTLTNDLLRQTNSELQELKDRYSDLYHHAPVMYCSLDAQARFIECNNTLLHTLGYDQSSLIGQTYDRILIDSRRLGFAADFEQFLGSGSAEVESQWVKANGEVLDVWITGTVTGDPQGTAVDVRIIAQDVTARHRLEAELREKNERLARTNEELLRKNKEMDEFTYVVSHDLQEPLRTLIAFSDFLLRDCGDQLNADGQEYVRYLVEASRRMRALIHGLLHLSRAGKVTGDFSTVNLEEIVGVVKADLAELIRTKGADVRTIGALPTLWGDRDRIGQLVANLVSNGLKYGRQDQPWVEIGSISNHSSHWTTFYVRDNGIGIDPQFHSKIFQLFRRLHTREEYEGTGAGLAISHKIVQAHGGRIWVESEPDHGSTFFVSLPCPPAVQASKQAQRSHAS